ncbi:WD40/YVTN/BNR-like repeat-containing protein, partial [Actinomadura harenae]
APPSAPAAPRTQADLPQVPPQAPAQPPAPPAMDPFPYAQQIPDAAPKAAEPFPFAQQIPETPKPAAPQPAAPEPFPYAQQIPDKQPSSDPFPYAQQIPDKQPNAPEPFPYAQEIPQGGLARGPQPPVADRTMTDHTVLDQPSGFPYAQRIPDAGTRVDEGVQPMAPPLIDEPWRSDAKSGKKGRSGKDKAAKAPGQSRSKKPLIIGVAGVVVLAAAGGGGFFLLRGGGHGGGGENVKAGDAVFPTGQLSAQDGRARRLTAVGTADATVVAVGAENDRGWFVVSTDGGRTFAPASVRDTDGDAAAPGEIPGLVAGSGHGWVAIGSRPGGGTVWTSSDGREWRRQAEPAGSQFGPKSHVKRLIATDSGFVAVGETSRRGDFRDTVPAVWTSSDGVRWEEHAGGGLGLPIRKGKVTLYDAAASGSALLVEGFHAVDAKHTGRKVWRSTNGGKSWAESVVPVPKGTRGLVIGGAPAGFVALREINDGGKAFAQAFTSKDGGSWTKAGSLQTSGYRMTTHLAGSDKGFAALVVRGHDLLISRSASGSAWQDGGTLAAPEGRAAAGFALSGEQPVVVGQDARGGPAPVLAAWDGSGAPLPGA